MQETKPNSNIFAILKTTAFFALIAAVVGAAAYIGTRGDSPKTDADDYEVVDIYTLSDFDYYSPQPNEKPDQEKLQKNQIPENVKKLHGRKVSITGFMLPVRVDDQGYVSEFALNGNYDMCFYGAPSQINQWVHVKMLPGAKAKFSHNQTTISGTLEVGEQYDDGVIVSLYRLNGHKAAGKPRRSY